ncbi:flagellar basal-body rod protein FlgC [Neorhizobium huautlense]|uniref:Flagellar basal-body rod protein FlgC n=1 Tax=Neorhizobium huautlense TaxID=67774 RepID=A0ABT9PQG7_9HYPH|nr:flagellar basal body protein [Neorhizobium huautlense]MDP9836711.1 flagellar basal-body rod protein FlgC [Neorhizobium huautlense]
MAMTITAALNTSVFGMQTETNRLSTAAHNIANASTPGYENNLTQDMLDVMQAETGFAANASVFETGADMWDMLMTVVRD